MTYKNINKINTHDTISSIGEIDPRIGKEEGYNDILKKEDKCFIYKLEKYHNKYHINYPNVIMVYFVENFN